MTFTMFIQILKILPELVSLAKTLLQKAEDGWTELQIKNAIKGIDEAFNEKDPQISARKLNDIFRK